MIKIQGISLVNVKDDVTIDGYGFHADIKLNSTKVGTVVAHADGSTRLDTYIQEKYKDRFDTAVQTFIENMKEKEDGMFLHYLEQFDSGVQSFIEYLFKLREVEKMVRKVFKNPAYNRAFIITTYLDDTYVFGVEEDKISTDEEIKSFKNQDSLKYVWIVKEVEDLSFKF